MLVQRLIVLIPAFTSLMFRIDNQNYTDGNYYPSIEMDDQLLLGLSDQYIPDDFVV